MGLPITDYLKLCRNCLNTGGDHDQEHCLFGSTDFKPYSCPVCIDSFFGIVDAKLERNKISRWCRTCGTWIKVDV